MAFTLNAGPVSDLDFPATTHSVVLNGVTAGDIIVVAIHSNDLEGYRNITSVTCTGESNLTVVHSYDRPPATFSPRQWFAYLLEATSSGNKTITVTYDSESSASWIAALSFTPDFGGVQFDGVASSSGTGTYGTFDISAPVAESLIFVNTNHDSPPVTPGVNYIQSSNINGRGSQYDADAGPAGLKAVDFTQTFSGFLDWGAGAIVFSHNQFTLLDYTGDGGAEANSAASIVDNTATNFNYIGDGGAEANSAASIVDNLATSFNYIGDGGAEANSTADALFVETNNPGAASFEALTAEGAGEAGTGGIGRGYFQAMTATGTGLVPFTGAGEAVFEAMFAVGYGPNEGAAAFEALIATGMATQGGVGVASFKPLEVVKVEGIASFQPLAAVGYGQVVVSDEFTTKVVNLRTGAVTEFTNYEYNSFARIGTKYFGAGPVGLVRLEGATDPGGRDIDWRVKTGQMDDKDPGLKRLPEVLLGLRSNNRVTVRVHPDDNTGHDYHLPVVQRTTIHQHRVVPGKGMRSRWFAVGLRGVNNATLELDSMQVNMTKTTRRLG